MAEHGAHPCCQADVGIDSGDLAASSVQPQKEHQRMVVIATTQPNSSAAFPTPLNSGDKFLMVAGAILGLLITYRVAPVTSILLIMILLALVGTGDSDSNQ
ncbi:MAG: hypothetical protein KDA54_09230 [Phycisphaerales bacterium]|nr:hypothetical protein [Phycisphaerales bacterium]